MGFWTSKRIREYKSEREGYTYFLQENKYYSESKRTVTKINYSIVPYGWSEAWGEPDDTIEEAIIWLEGKINQNVVEV